MNTLRPQLPRENSRLTNQEHSQLQDAPIEAEARSLVSFEFARALRDACCLPWHAAGQFLGNQQLLRDIRSDLASTPSFAPDQRELHLPSRPLRIFISCAEASGETHAINWVRALRAVLAECGAPAPELVGLGGPQLAAQGVQLLGDPVSDARMGFSGVLQALPFYLKLLRRSAQSFTSGGLDLFLGVDSPALNVPLAQMAKRSGVLTAQYITPQYWGWAPWRVAGFKRAFDLALSILPFEPAWFRRHGVAVEHVGHPQMDVFQTRAGLAREERAEILAILPGSRRSVIARNLPLMLESLRAHIGGAAAWRALILQGSRKHRALIDECIERSALDRAAVEVSYDLEAGLAQTKAALSVSGTILTHLLHHRIPTVVVYRLESAFQQWMGRHFLTVPYFSSVNLLAGRMVYPEFSFAAEEGPPAFFEAVERLVNDRNWREACSAELEIAAQRLGPAGASRRAALAVLNLIPGVSPPQKSAAGAR